MVGHPGEYRWSSYGADAPIDPRLIFLSLGADLASRAETYWELFRSRLEPGLFDEIRLATNGNFALGDRFGEQVAQALGRRAVRGGRRRPQDSDGGGT